MRFSSELHRGTGSEPGETSRGGDPNPESWKASKRFVQTCARMLTRCPPKHHGDFTSVLLELQSRGQSSIPDRGPSNGCLTSPPDYFRTLSGVVVVWLLLQHHLHHNWPSEF